jgi:methyl-accepting chemotaxis protein
MKKKNSAAKQKNSSITFKVGLAISLLIIFLMSAVGIANYYRTRTTLENQVLDKGWSIVSTGTAFAKEYLRAGIPALPAEFLTNIKAVPNVNYIAVMDKEGRVMNHTEPFDNRHNSGTNLPDKPMARKYTNNAGAPVINFLSPVVTGDGRIIGYLSLGLNTAGDEATLKNLLYNMLLTTSAAVIAGLFLAMVLTRRILRKPIQDLMDATEHIAAGDFAHQVKVHNTDELGSLATAFNTMTGHLGNLFRSVQASAAEITKSSQIIISRAEDFSQSLECDRQDGDQALQSNYGQAESLREITSTARKMARLVDRLNSLSLQFKV